MNFDLPSAAVSILRELVAVEPPVADSQDWAQSVLEGLKWQIEAEERDPIEEALDPTVVKNTLLAALDAGVVLGISGPQAHLMKFELLALPGRTSHCLVLDLAGTTVDDFMSILAVFFVDLGGGNFAITLAVPGLLA